MLNTNRCEICPNCLDVDAMIGENTSNDLDMTRVKINGRNLENDAVYISTILRHCDLKFGIHVLKTLFYA